MKTSNAIISLSEMDELANQKKAGDVELTLAEKIISTLESLPREKKIEFMECFCEVLRREGHVGDAYFIACLRAVA